MPEDRDGWNEDTRIAQKPNADMMRKAFRSAAVYREKDMCSECGGVKVKQGGCWVCMCCGDSKCG